MGEIANNRNKTMSTQNKTPTPLTDEILQQFGEHRIGWSETRERVLAIERRAIEAEAKLAEAREALAEIGRRVAIQGLPADGFTRTLISRTLNNTIPTPPNQTPE